MDQNSPEYPHISIKPKNLFDKSFLELKKNTENIESFKKKATLNKNSDQQQQTGSGPFNLEDKTKRWFVLAHGNFFINTKIIFVFIF